jgi:hypothetical protein
MEMVNNGKDVVDEEVAAKRQKTDKSVDLGVGICLLNVARILKVKDGNKAFKCDKTGCRFSHAKLETVTEESVLKAAGKLLDVKLKRALEKAVPIFGKKGYFLV